MINDALVQSNNYVPTGELSVSFLAPIQKLFPNIYSELIEYIDARTVCSKKFGDRYLNSIITVLDGELYDYYKTNFADVLDRFCAQHVLPTVVMTLPGEPNSLLLKELFHPLEEIYRDTNISFYNSYDAFHKSYNGLRHRKCIHVNNSNPHSGSAAHRFYAEYLSEVLIRDFRRFWVRRKTGI